MRPLDRIERVLFVIVVLMAVITIAVAASRA